MKGKQKVLIVYVLFLPFFCSDASDRALEARIQGYVNLVSQGVGLRLGEYSRSAVSIALVKLALGRKEGADFLPDEEAVLHWLKKREIAPTLKDPDTKGTLLHFAAFYGAGRVMHFLLYKARVPITVDKEGKSPLHWACDPYNKMPRKEVVELLVRVKKSLIHGCDSAQKTPLFYLSSYSEVADYLLEKGANINAQDDYGWTPLFMCKDEESTRYLCSHGADVNQQDDRKLPILGAYLTEYVSRLDVAKKKPECLSKEVNGLQEGIKVLLQYGCYVHLRYHPAYKMKSLDSDHLEKERMKRIKVLQTSFGDILRPMEEALEWVKVRSALSEETKTIQGVSPVLFFDRYVSLLPFFKARYKEMEEILEKEKGPESCGSVFTFEEFLSRLSFSKHISPALAYVSCDLMCNKEKYEAARFLPEEQRSEMGKKIMEKVFSLKED